MFLAQREKMELHNSWGGEMGRGVGRYSCEKGGRNGEATIHALLPKNSPSRKSLGGRKLLYG